MANVTISEAIRLSGVSRSTFYTSYINKGRITVSSDRDGKKCIDTSELLRVFGELKRPSEKTQQNSTSEQHRTTDKNSFKLTQKENLQLKQQLEEARRREQEFSDRELWYQSQISSLTSSIKLLEAPKPLRPWWKVWK